MSVLEVTFLDAPITETSMQMRLAVPGAPFKLPSDSEGSLLLLDDPHHPLKAETVTYHSIEPDGVTFNLSARGANPYPWEAGSFVRALERTGGDQDEHIINVKRFGVKGDGSDETQKIQSAVDEAVTSGYTLYFPPGVYGVSKQGTLHGRPYAIKASGGDLRIAGTGTIKYLSPVDTPASMVLAASMGVVNVSGVTFDGDHLGAWTSEEVNGIEVIGAVDTDIQRSVFKNMRRGVYLRSDSVIGQLTTTNIRWNRFDAVSRMGVEIQSESHPLELVNISNNSIKISPVSWAGQTPNDSVAGVNCLASALITNVEYNYIIGMSASQRVTDVNFDFGIIVANNTGSGVNGTVSISQNIIHNIVKGIDTGAGSVQGHIAALYITGNKITSSTSIHVETGVYGLADRFVECSGNYVRFTSPPSSSKPRWGLLFDDGFATNVVLEGVSVAHNEVHSIPGHGIMVQSTSGGCEATVTENKTAFCGSASTHGLGVNVGRGVVANNRVYRSGGHGIYTRIAINGIVSGNEALDNSGDGIRVDTSTNMLVSGNNSCNRATSNQQSGIHVTASSTDITVRDNVLLGNAVAPITALGSVNTGTYDGHGNRTL